MAILVATLIDQGKALSDKRIDASVPDTDWLTYVIWGVKSAWRFLCSLDPGAYFTQAPDFTLAGGTTGATKDLSTLTPGWKATNRRTVPRRNFRERNKGRVSWWTPAPPATDRAYDMRGRVLTITPYELAGGVYRIYYRALPYIFTATNDSNPLDWQLEDLDEMIVILAARKGLGIEESDEGPWINRLNEIKQEFQDEHTRDDGEPLVIADVEDEETGPWWP